MKSSMSEADAPLTGSELAWLLGAFAVLAASMLSFLAL